MRPSRYGRCSVQSRRWAGNCDTRQLRRTVPAPDDQAGGSTRPRTLAFSYRKIRTGLWDTAELKNGYSAQSATRRTAT
jgi:hypothetical protein